MSLLYLYTVQNTFDGYQRCYRCNNSTPSMVAPTGFERIDTANGPHWKLIGQANSIPAGDFSLNAGVETTDISGKYAFVAGRSNSATNLNSVATGTSNKATLISSVAIGSSNISSGWYSNAIGYNTKAMNWLEPLWVPTTL